MSNWLEAARQLSGGYAKYPLRARTAKGFGVVLIWSFRKPRLRKGFDGEYPIRYWLRNSSRMPSNTPSRDSFFETRSMQPPVGSDIDLRESQPDVALSGRVSPWQME